MVQFRPLVRYILSFILVVFLSLTTIQAQTPSKSSSKEKDGRYVTIPQQQIDWSKTKNPSLKSIPMKVKCFFDPNAQIQCHQLDENQFTPVNQSFHPGFYKGVLWLQCEFEDNLIDCNEYFNLTFGFNSFTLAEVFAYNSETGQWNFVGRTGKSIPKTEMDQPSNMSTVNFNRKDFSDESTHKIRVRIISYSGSPIKLKLLPSIIFFNQEKNFAKLHSMFMTFAGILIILVLLVGLFLKDSLYLTCGCTTFIVYILTIVTQELGTGNLIPLNHQTPAFFSMTNFTNLMTIALAHFIYAKILGECKEKKDFNIHIVVGGSISTACILFLFMGSSPKSAYIVVNSGIIIAATNLIILWIKNLHSGRSKSYIILDWWSLSLMIVIAVRINCFFQFFMPLNSPVFDLTPFMLQSVFFFLMMIPSIFFATSRYKAKIKRLNQLNKNSNNVRKENLENMEIMKNVNKLIYASEHAARNILHLQWLNKSTENIPVVLESMDKNQSLLIAQSIMQTGILPPDSEDPYGLEDLYSLHMDFWQTFISKRNFIASSKTQGLENQTTKMDKKILGFFLDSMFFNCSRLSLDNSKFTLFFKLDEGDKLTFKITTSTDSMLHKHTKETMQTSKMDSELGFELMKKILPYYEGNFYAEDIGSGFDFVLTFKIDCTYSKFTLKEIHRPDRIATNASHNFWENLLTVEKQKPKVLLATGDIFLRNLFEPFFSDICHFHMASSGDEAWRILNASKTLGTELPDIVICDLELPVLSGLELFRKALSDPILQNIPFAFMLDKFNIEQTKTLVAMGAVDTMIRPCSVERICRCIHSVFSTSRKVKKTLVGQITRTLLGESPMVQPSPTPVHEQPKAISPSPTATDAQAKIFQLNNLSAKEQQIATLMSEGKTDKEIAEALNISVGTVATHNKRIFKKLDVHSRIELVNKVR